MVENIIEAMVDAVLVVDTEGRITLANASAERLTGHERGALRELAVGELLVDNSSGLRTGVRRRIEDGDVLRRESSWLVAKDGTRIPVSVTGSPVLAADGSLQGIVLVARDIRQMRALLADKEAEIGRRRRLEDELRATAASIEDQLERTRTQLLLAERRATLGTLAGGVGHELRNIAQIQVAVVAELEGELEAGADMAALVRELLPDLRRVGEHITQHGSRLLQLARPGPDHVAPTDLNTIVRDVVDMLRGAGKLRRVQLGLVLGAEPLTVTVNRTRIEQILVNLIVNAVDAIGSSSNGKVSITVRASSDLARVICEVHDTGCGIPTANLDKIWEPFFTTKPAELGTGLGLPVAREIVASYGGSLTVVSAPDTGTTFTFELPR